MSPNQRYLRQCSPAHPADDGPQQDPIITPREAMRRSNCQDYRFHRAETYPSIRTQVSRCDPSKAQAIAWLANSLEADGCGRPFDTKQDDVLPLWQQSPRKDTLGFYGVGSPSHQPESVMFNQALMASLNKVGVDGTRRRSKRPTPPTPPKKTPISGNSVQNQMCQPLILNRQALQAELQQMPIIQRRLHPQTAFETICTLVADPYDPLGVAQHEEMMASRGQALDMERPPVEKPHGLRRRHWYCPSDCGGEQSACSQYEWAKYKLDPRPYNKEFRQWLLEQKAIKSPEPKDYDQLYERFLKCFEQKPSPDPLCKIYEICCGKDSRGGDGQGGDGQGGGDGGSGRPGGVGDDEGTTGETDGTGDKDKDRNKDRNKDKDNDNDKVVDLTKDKNKGGTGDNDKAKDRNKYKDNDNDKDKNKEDKDKDKNKKDKDKNKDNVTGKETGDGKDKGKGGGDKDGDSTGADGKRKSGDNQKGGKKRKVSLSDADNELSSKIPKWQSDEAIRKPPTWIEGEDLDGVPINNMVDQLAPDDEFLPKDPDTATKTGLKNGKKNGKKKNTKKDRERGKENAKNKDEDKNKVKKTCHLCPPPGCPCEICAFMNRKRLEQDASFIEDMKRAEKKRELQDYMRQMCHREYIRNRCQQQHPHFEKHRDCLGAVHDLEKLLAGCQDKGLDQKLLNLVENLRRRIYQRMSDCIHPHLNRSGAQFGF